MTSYYLCIFLPLGTVFSLGFDLDLFLLEGTIAAATAVAAAGKSSAGILVAVSLDGCSCTLSSLVGRELTKK